MLKHSFILGLVFSAAFILTSGQVSAQKRSSHHSGNYKGGSGSSHKGGSYKNSSTSNHYVKRKRH